MKTATIKNLSMLFGVFLLSACVPEQVTEFQKLLDVPVGDGASVVLDEDTSTPITYTIPLSDDAIDPEYEVAAGPYHGELLGCSTGDKRTLDCTYVPDSDYYGTDAIYIKAVDGSVTSRTNAKISITVNNVNDAPELSGSSSFSVKKGTSYVFEAIKGMDIDNPQSSLTYQIVSSPSHGVLSGCFLGTSTACTYTADAGYTGPDSLTYRVVDPDGAASSGTASVAITVQDGIYTKSESFTLETSKLNSVDIVWVIDNSGSMQNEQEALQDNFASFINNFFDNGTPKFAFNMMVTTTDAYINGNPKSVEDPMTGDLYKLSSADAIANFPKFEQDFKDAVNVGIRGNGQEKALLSLQANYNAESAWFSGDDSLLVYIILSDEAEQSDTMNIDQWTSYIKGLKTQESRTKVYPIINQSADPGNRYANLAANFGTQVASILAPFDSVLDGISLDIEEQTKVFPLTFDGVIDQSTINVEINGTLLPKLDGNGDANWIYQNKSIQLVNDPPANATIDITYTYQS